MKAPFKVWPVCTVGTVVNTSRCFNATIRRTKYYVFLEVMRQGSKGLRYIPPDQLFTIDVNDIRGVISLLRTAERKAVERGLLVDDGGAA